MWFAASKPETLSKSIHADWALILFAEDTPKAAYLGSFRHSDNIARSDWKHRQDDPQDIEKHNDHQGELSAAVSLRTWATVEASYTEAEIRKIKIKYLAVVRGSHFVLRLVAVVNAFLCLYLILSSVIAFRVAQHKPGHPLSSIQGSGSISALPWIIFAIVAGSSIVLNFFLLVIFCCLPKQASVPDYHALLLIWLTPCTGKRPSWPVLYYHWCNSIWNCAWLLPLAQQAQQLLERSLVRDNQDSVS